MATPLKTVMDFLKNDPNPPKMKEMKEFKDSCKDGEIEEFAKQIDPDYASK